MSSSFPKRCVTSHTLVRWVVKLMIDAVKQMGIRSGRELEKPVSLTIAPTGVAAYLVNGTTIESALGMQPQKSRSYLNNTARKNSNCNLSSYVTAIWTVGPFLMGIYGNLSCEKSFLICRLF